MLQPLVRILQKFLHSVYRLVQLVQQALRVRRVLPAPLDLRVVMGVMVLTEAQALQDLRVQRRALAHHQLLQDR